ncbi:MAG: hypothetical protein IJP61_02110 [Treponema sp.]|nr:hypothetical protein [Treponema sp.]
MNRVAKLFFVIFLSAAVYTQAFAFLASSEKYNYSIDFPEGFEIAEMEEDESSILFACKYLEAKTLIRVWEKDKFKNSDEAMKHTMTRLEADASYQGTTWRKQEASIAMFSSPLLLAGEMASGWGFTVALPLQKGYLTILSYTKKELSDDLMQVLVSVLDSVMIDDGSFKEPGIITSTYFPREKEKSVSLKIGGKTVRTKIDEIDAEANQFVIDREFSVFKFYVDNNLPEVYDAWVRFYRIIGKDATLRLKKVSFDIYSALRSDSNKKDSSNPNAALAQTLLNWVQEFSYERASTSPDKADITDILSTLTGKSSDCDARSLLLAVLYKNLGIESCMFISSEYSHAMVGAFLEGKQGQTISVDGRDFLVGETTAKGLTFGLMDSTMQDRKKWITVEIY